MYYRHIPLISKTGFKAEFMGNDLFHLVQMTALKQEERAMDQMWARAQRPDGGSGSPSST